MNKLWVQKQNILPEGMPQKFVYQKRVMKDSIDLLNEEFKPNRNKEKFNNIKFNEFQRSSSSKIRDYDANNGQRVLMILAGLPPTTALSGTSLVTTAPAATTALRPMVTPGQMMAPMHIHAFSLMVT